MATEQFETVVVGGGQAGLAVGYHLAKRRQPFMILDASERIGDAWRTRWDSLRLFTPARYDGLPGRRFPASRWAFPTKDEMAGYLEDYSARFDLPVRSGVRVDRLSREGGRYVVEAGDSRFEADRVVVATGAHRAPKVPDFASELDPRITQLHSSEYRNPAQLQDGDVLLVGAGNSGAEIAFELSRTHRCRLAGPDTGHIPVRHGSVPSQLVFPLVRFVGHRVLTRRTPIGRKLGPKLTAGGDPLIRVKPKDLVAAGVERLPRVVGVRDGLPVLEDDRVLDVENVIWCTGFRQEFPWIDLPVFDEAGRPRHTRGVVESEPGLFFVGLPFLYAVSSDVLPGVGRDSRYLVKRMTSRRAKEMLPGRPVSPAPTLTEEVTRP